MWKFKTENKKFVEKEKIWLISGRMYCILIYENEEN